MRDTLCEEAKRLIERTMEAYISGEEEKLRRAVACFSPAAVVIGTGKHEFYLGLPALLEGLQKDQEEAKNISFVIEDAWYEARPLTENSCIVYGEFRARERDGGKKQILIDMDTRITAGLHREAGGRLIIDSLHHSVPYLYQQADEYYPKSFSDLAEQALERSSMLEQVIQLDPMTGLYNRKYTEKHIARLLTQDKEKGLLFVVDMDDFKQVNDTLGHLQGDALLKGMAAVLKENAPAGAIVGRVGGDEFMLFLPGPPDRARGEAVAAKLIAGMDGALSGTALRQSCSLGILAIEGEAISFEEAYRRADAALYRAKTQGKGRFFWYEGK